MIGWWRIIISNEDGDDGDADADGDDGDADGDRFLSLTGSVSGMVLSSLQGLCHLTLSMIL